MDLLYFRNRWPAMFELPGSIPDCGEGWFPLIAKLCQDIEAVTGVGDPDFRFLQIKEKFGGLKVYRAFVHGSSALITEHEMHVTNLVTPLLFTVGTLIKQAEGDSYKICEACGAPGTTRSNSGWLQTRCNACYKECK